MTTVSKSEIETLGAELSAFTAGAVPALDATPGEIAETCLRQGMTDRAGYLAWVARYRDLERRAADLQRRMKAALPGSDEAWFLQMKRHGHAGKITRMIRLRRLSRLHAAAQVRLAREAADAA